MTARVWSDLAQICLRGFPVWSPGGSNSGSLLRLGNPQIHRQRLLALRGNPGQKGKVCNDLLSISLVNVERIRKINNDLRNTGNYKINYHFKIILLTKILTQHYLSILFFIFFF